MSKMGISARRQLPRRPAVRDRGPARRSGRTESSPAPCRASPAPISPTSNPTRSCCTAPPSIRCKPLAAGGLLKFMYGGEYHAYNPDVVQQLQKAVQERQTTRSTGNTPQVVNSRPVAMIRDLMKPKFGVNPIPVDEVEPVEAILKRFDSRRHVAGRVVARGARGPGRRHEPHRRRAPIPAKAAKTPRATAPSRPPRSSRWPPAASA